MASRPPPTLRRPLGLLAVVLALALAPPARADDEEAAVLEAVRGFEIPLEAVLLEGDALGFRARYERLARPAARTHAFAVMARRRAGSAWEELGEDDRAALESLVFKRVVAAWALAVPDAAGARLERGELERLEDGAWRVGAVIEAGEARRPVAHRVESIDGAWRITSVPGEGADAVARERAARERTFSEGGFEALREAFAEAVPLPEADPETTRSPRDVVEVLQQGLLGVMRDAGSLDFEARYARLEPLVRSTHHLDAIAQLTLRRGWGDLDERQRARFTERFARYSIGRYASRFDGWNGETFQITDDREAGSTHRVRSILRKGDGDTVTFDYALRRLGGRWKILNITVNGVSDLATKQAEYGGILQREGFDALMRALEEQIARHGQPE